MLTVLFGEMPDLMKQIAEFYFPPNAKILDVSFGNGHLVQRLQVTGVDIDPTAAAQITADSTDLPLDDEAFNAAIFDPPYLYGRSRKALKERPTWAKVRSEQETPEQFVARAQGTASELHRVLVPGGLAVVKVADARVNGKLVLNHILAIESFASAGFALRDLIVYVRTGTGVFKNQTNAQGAHGYFLIFEKPAQMSLEAVA